MNKYSIRGASSQKEDVHNAIRNLSKGLFPNAFCKIYPDYLGGSDAWCNIMHADGAGTKSVLAYMYWKETGDTSVWKGIAIDAIVMNLDDMLCAGATGPFTYASTIGRNKNLIPGEVVSALINGTQEYFDLLASLGIDIHFMGGETADLGDLVRTIVVDGVMACRMPRNRIIDPSKIVAGDVVVSFASYGQAAWEQAYNSGIGSNGLTSARHELLAADYRARYPESVDPDTPVEYVYTGKYQLTDMTSTGLNIGQMLLSPTRTYAPLLKAVYESYFEDIHAVIHCSGGGQSKILHYLPEGLKVVKHQLLPIPPLFSIIQEAGSTGWAEMYQVFNMGQRLEIYTTEETAEHLLALSASLNIEAVVSGTVSKSGFREVLIDNQYGPLVYR